MLYTRRRRTHQIFREFFRTKNSKKGEDYMLKEIMARKKQDITDSRATTGKKGEVKVDIPADMFVKCTDCGRSIYRKEMQSLHNSCPNCNKLFRLSAKARVDLVTDEGSFQELDIKVERKNPLNFPEYDAKLDKAEKASGLKEAVLCGECKIEGSRAIICVMDSHFMMGSMGSAVGEYLATAFEVATARRLPIVIFTASGGARMQEGIVSLMQMAKVSGALAAHSEEGLLYITVLTDPTTGGVTASFASLGDIILAEKGALIGFAGRRVIEQTIRQKLPSDFQSAEFLLEKGFVDAIVDRSNQKEVIGKILSMH
jgi:acetyl-CoA carboxylase carboxyl transferase subunit beta